MSISVQDSIKDLKIYNGYIAIAYDQTMMTVPKVLLNALQSVCSSPKKYLKDLASNTKRELLSTGLTDKDIKGKLSTKVQEIAWNRVLINQHEVVLTDFSKSVTIPYRCNGEATTMTVPYFIFKIIFDKNERIVNENYPAYSEAEKLKKAKKESIAYIALKASEVKSKLQELLTPEELTMKLSQKVHEIIILDEISEKAKRQSVIL